MSSAFDWDKFKVSPQVNNEPVQQSNPIPQTEEKPAFQFDKFPTEKEKPSTREEIKRHTIRSGSRAAETIAGLPGDFLNFVDKATGFITEKITGKEAPKSLNLLPTSSKLQEISENLSGGYTKPQSENEQISDTVLSDIVSLALPVKGKIPFTKAVGIAVGSNLAEKGSEMLGAEEGGQTATKIGTTFFLSAFNPKGASRFANKLFGDAKALIQPGSQVSASNLSGKINSLDRELSKGKPNAPYKSKAKETLNEISSKIQNGYIPVEELTEFKVDINKARESLYIDQNLDKAGKRLAKRNLDSVASIIDDSLKEYGHTNPQWQKAYREANEVYGSIAQSKKVSTAIGRFIKQNPHSSTIGLLGEIFFLPKTIPAVAAGYGILKGVELIARIRKSPALTRYYTGVLEGALKDDFASISKNISKLEAGLKKEEED